MLEAVSKVYIQSDSMKLTNPLRLPTRQMRQDMLEALSKIYIQSESMKLTNPLPTRQIRQDLLERLSRDRPGER